jgi:hypothetical protein
VAEDPVGGIAQIGPAVEQMRGLGSRRWQAPAGTDGETPAPAAANGAGNASPPAPSSSATSSQVLGPDAGEEDNGSAGRARGRSADSDATAGDQGAAGDGEATDDVGVKLAEAGPLFDRLRAGDYAGALAQVETDDRLHAAASDIARDPEMLKAAMDRANIRSKAARRAADRIFSHLAG